MCWTKTIEVDIGYRFDATEEEGKAFISSTVNGSTRDFKRESVVGGIPRILSLTSFSRLCDEMQNLKNSEL